MIKPIAKFVLTAIIPFSIFSSVAIVCIQAAEASSLQITFQNRPLFKNANFIPGDSVTRWIKVANNSGEKQTILIKSDNANDPNHLANAMNLVIKRGLVTLYKDSFANFLNGDLIALSQLESGAAGQYNLTVSFNSAADNFYQNKTLNFDILIGSDDNIFATDNPDNQDEITITPTPIPTSSPSISPTLSPLPSILPTTSPTPLPSSLPTTSPVFNENSEIKNIFSSEKLSENSIEIPSPTASPTLSPKIADQPNRLADILGVSPSRWLIYIFISLIVGFAAYLFSRKWF